MQARGVGLADVGRKRSNNEDCWLADDQLGLYAVSDGMGGHRGGEVASRTAIGELASALRAGRDVLERASDGTAKPKEVQALVRTAFRQATQAVYDLGGSQKDGMGCTLTALVVTGHRGVVGHAGDSRLYLLREGELHQLSRDHTLAAELARKGAIEADDVKKHPYGHVLTQTVGRLECQPDVFGIELLPGDRALLCSDGFSNYMSVPEWLAGKLGEEDLDGIPEELVRFAYDAGGGDNITTLVVGVEAEPTDAQRQAAEAIRAKLKALGGSFLCERMSLARQALLINHCTLREHAPGKVAVAQGQPLTGLSVVVGGVFEVRAADGSAGRLLPGDHFGASALVSPRAARATVTARDAARTLTLTPAGLQALTRIRPRLGAIFFRRVARVLAEGLDAATQTGAQPPASCFLP
ncbi:MAG: protein phosphatase 2C domain-containing protein [Planctomycetes bacterium]|nr:protein phosphatase 2C domain-containing protein [Planctomycetota bacterium]